MILYASRELDLLELPSGWANPSLHASEGGLRWFWRVDVAFAAAVLRAFQKAAQSRDPPSAKMWAGFGEILDYLSRHSPGFEREVERLAAAGPVKLPEIPVLPAMVECGLFPKWPGWERWRDSVRATPDVVAAGAEHRGRSVA